MSNLKKIFVALAVLTTISVAIFFSFFIALAVLGLFIIFFSFAFIQKIFTSVYDVFSSRSNSIGSDPNVTKRKTSPKGRKAQARVIIDQEYKEKPDSKNS